MQRIMFTVVGAGLLSAMLFAQTSQFDVASMKSLPTGAPGRQRTADGAQIHYQGASLLSLLREAYRLKRPEQVVGPSWMRTQMYAIEAKLPPNASQDQIPDMLRAPCRPAETIGPPRNAAHAHQRAPIRYKVKMRPVEDWNEGLLLKLESPSPLVDLSGRGSIIELLDQLNHGLGGSRPW